MATQSVIHSFPQSKSPVIVTFNALDRPSVQAVS